MLFGKRMSILGDSLSTYLGVSNDKNANKRLLFNPSFYKPPFPVEKTYWHLLLEKFHMELCVNNSYSGGNLSGRGDEDAGVNRAAHLSREDGTSPDLILVLMGLNDLGRQVDAEVFAADYRDTLCTLKKKYPEALVCCVNLPDRDIYLKQRAEVFNAAIAAAVAAAGENFFLADLFHSRLNNDTYYMNTVDGLHLDEDGMRILAEVIGAAIEARCA